MLFFHMMQKHAGFRNGNCVLLCCDIICPSDLLFPYWMEYAIKAKGPEKFVKFATRIFGCQNDFEHPEVTAMEGVKLLRAFFDELGMPNSISSLGGKPEDIPGMVENMFYGAPNHGSFIKLTPEIAAEIYSMAM